MANRVKVWGLLISLAAFTLAACNGATQHMPAPQPTNGSELPQAVPNADVTPLTATLSDYDVHATTSLELPEVGKIEAWVVSMDKPIRGVVAEIDQQLVVVHPVEPQPGRLLGPYPSEVMLMTKDLNGDGTPEVLVSGDGGNGHAIWVYTFVHDTLTFDYQGDLHGDGIQEIDDSAGGVTFEVVTIQRSTSGRASTSEYWKWKPGVFVKLE